MTAAIARDPLSRGYRCPPEISSHAVHVVSKPLQFPRAIGRHATRKIAARHASEVGSDPRRAPTWLCLRPYVEVTFRGWTVRGGMRRHDTYILQAEIAAMRGDSDGAMRALTTAAELGWRYVWLAQHHNHITEMRPSTLIIHCANGHSASEVMDRWNARQSCILAISGTASTS